jgi:hypothetical protein
VDRNIGVVDAAQRGADGRNLTIEIVDQLGAVLAGDPELRSPKQRLLDSDGSGVSLASITYTPVGATAM